MEIFDQLEQDIGQFSHLGSVILMGDFKSRTGKYSGSVSQEGSDIIMNDQSVSSLICTQRKSFDNALNSNGNAISVVDYTI